MVVVDGGDGGGGVGEVLEKSYLVHQPSAFNPQPSTLNPQPSTLTLPNPTLDPKNLVYVLSGKERQDLDAALGSVQGLGLAAEAGFFYRKAKVS